MCQSKSNGCKVSNVCAQPGYTILGIFYLYIILFACFKNVLTLFQSCGVQLRRLHTSTSYFQNLAAYRHNIFFGPVRSLLENNSQPNLQTRTICVLICLFFVINPVTDSSSQSEASSIASIYAKKEDVTMCGIALRVQLFKIDPNYNL